MSTAAYREGLFADASGEVIVLLLTITHPQLSQPIRLSSDNATLLNFEQQLRGTISRGLSFSFIPMDVQLPEQGDEVIPMLTVTLYDVARVVAPLLEATVTPAYVTVEIVAAPRPDIVEKSYAIFRLTGADISGDSVRLNLVVDAMGDEPFPADKFTPSGFPGLWLAY